MVPPRSNPCAGVLDPVVQFPFFLFSRVCSLFVLLLKHKTMPVLMPRDVRTSGTLHGEQHVACASKAQHTSDAAGTIDKIRTVVLMLGCV